MPICQRVKVPKCYHFTLHSTSILSPMGQFYGRWLFCLFFLCARPLCVRELSHVHCPKVQRKSPLSQKSLCAVVVVSWGKKGTKKVISMRAAVPQMEIKKITKIPYKENREASFNCREWMQHICKKVFSLRFFATWRISHPLMVATCAVRSGISLRAHCSSYGSGIKASLLLCMIIQRRTRQRQILFSSEDEKISGTDPASTPNNTS